MPTCKNCRATFVTLLDLAENRLVDLDVMPSPHGSYIITDSIKRQCRKSDQSEWPLLDQAGHQRLKRHNCQNVH